MVDATDGTAESPPNARGHARERIRSLRADIERHNALYHGQDAPEIGDAEYDGLMRELRALEAAHPALATSDSPTQTVGAPPVKGFAEARHPVPLLSLGNAFDPDDLIAWHGRASTLLGPDFEMVCELKYDGLAVALTYEDGEFVRGATRGDGRVGEDVTANLRTIGNLPKTVSAGAPKKFEVRGEVLFPNSSFAAFNRRRKAEGLPLYANPRNTAAGSLRQIDSSVTEERPLDIYIYSLGYPEDKIDANNHFDTLAYLASLGFNVNPNNSCVNTLDGVLAYYQKWLSRKRFLNYACDGVVIKVNRFDQQHHLGHVGREPRWAIAYKFPDKQVETTLLDIKVNVGRTGSLNPYAVLKPVEIDGATIRRATLHNEDFIRSKDLRKGDRVIVERAGGVIPQVVRSLLEKRQPESKPFAMPKQCPVCGHDVVRPEGEASSYCINARCPEQVARLIQHFVSKGAMDIDGLGEKQVALFLEKGLIKDAADIFALRDHRDDLLAMDRFGETSVTNLLASIETAKAQPLIRVLVGLGIGFVGTEVADLLARRSADLQKRRSADLQKRRSAASQARKFGALRARWISISQARQSAVLQARRFALLRSRRSNDSLARRLGDIGGLVEALIEDMEAVPGIGPKIAASVAGYFADASNVALVGRLRRAGVNLDDEERGATEEQIFEEKRFVVTGRMTQFSRSEIQDRIKGLGGAVSGSVSKKTDYVVVGQDAGSKLADAEALGIKTITEADLLAMIDTPSASAKERRPPPPD